jgi:hypothetical protein
MLTNTQEKIVALIEERKPKGKSWKKYYGDVCCRIFREFLLEEIPNNYTISHPNAYIEGFPTEFDLLIVNSDAKPKQYTNAFQPEKVRCGFEIKAHGLFGGREDLEKEIAKIKQKFGKVNTYYPSIDFVYLTYEEAAFVKRESSIKYLEETRKIMNPYKVFCLKDSRTGKVIEGEWKRLIFYLIAILPSLSVA